MLTLCGTLKEFKFKLLDSVKGTSEECCLRELNGKQRNRYFEEMKDKVEVGSDGSVKVKKFEGMQTDLLKLCLYHANGNLFAREEIDMLPASTVDRLFAESQRLSALDREEIEARKNG